MTASVPGFGWPTFNPVQPGPWNLSPFGGQSLGSFGQGVTAFQPPILQILQSIPQQLQQLQQLTYVQQQQMQQIQQLLVLIPHQLQQFVQQIVSQHQQFQHAPQHPWTGYAASPFGQPFFSNQPGQVM